MTTSELFLSEDEIKSFLLNLIKIVILLMAIQMKSLEYHLILLFIFITKMKRLR